MAKQSKIPWDKETWEKTKVEIKKMTGNWDMSNEKIQEKILELAETKNNKRGV